MKRRFVKPEIMSSAASSAWGNDSLLGDCTYGSYAGNPALGSCTTGAAPDSGNCTDGNRPTSNMCGTGNQVFGGAQCTVGSSVISTPNVCLTGSTPNQL